ncbi:MAG: hypothetical protein H6766_01195 [Candidatus Peribacteria bacterium]|nr:MAG: hypothetical protein H6766_01195 [Candidatus Peribacteria bacterium]
MTDDIQSPRAGWDYDSDDANVVMVLQNEAFADAGADGTNGVYADYIWIRK